MENCQMFVYRFRLEPKILRAPLLNSLFLDYLYVIKIFKKLHEKNYV